MTSKKEKRTSAVRWPLSALAVLALILALGISAYAVGNSVFGWQRNVEIRNDAHSATVIMDMDALTEPVELRDGRLFFQVNGENADISGQLSQTEPYLYQYLDAEGVTHYWIVGLNGPEPDSYGFAEFLRDGDEWLGGYSHNTLLPDGSAPTWFETGKTAYHIPW